MRFSLLGLTVFAACGSPSQTTFDGGAGEVPLEVTTIDAGCAVSVEQWSLGKGNHLPIGTDITWPSNPPSSGPHYPIWAAFQEYSSAVPRGYYVHDLEHGAVVLLSNCALVSGDCTPVLNALRAASASLPDDPKCSTDIRVRTVITPDPLIQQPIVAVSWGYIYRAACVDQPSLNAFVAAHYAQGTEDLCAQGTTQF